MLISNIEIQSSKQISNPKFQFIKQWFWKSGHADLKIVSYFVFQISILAAFVVSTVCFSSEVFADSPVMKTLSAHVVNVAEDGSSIAVDFHHPATDRVHRLIFYKDSQTGLSGIDRLNDLRAGQVVSIDYVEDLSGKFLIRRIAKVKLSGPPSGLEKFNGI